MSRGYHRTDKMLSLILGDVSTRSDESAFSVEHGPVVRRDTSGPHQHNREATIAAAAAAAAAAVQQHQQKQQQLLAQEHRLAELMQSGDQARSGHIPPGIPTSITADARGMPPAASSRSAGRPAHQRQQQPSHQPQRQAQQQQPPQPASAVTPASAADEPLRNHPHYRMLKELNRCVLSEQMGFGRVSVVFGAHHLIHLRCTAFPAAPIIPPPFCAPVRITFVRQLHTLCRCGAQGHARLRAAGAGHADQHADGDQVHPARSEDADEERPQVRMWAAQADVVAPLLAGLLASHF